MDLTDATLVALAEERGIRRIFSLDSDFQIYRYRDRQGFEVFPLCAGASPQSCVSPELPELVSSS